MNKFWMVWNEGNQQPRVKHISKILSLNECERLANNNPSEAFYLLEAISVSNKINVLTTKLD